MRFRMLCKNSLLNPRCPLVSLSSPSLGSNPFRVSSFLDAPPLETPLTSSSPFEGSLHFRRGDLSFENGDIWVSMRPASVV
jgi:hypothetical protein